MPLAPASPSELALGVERGFARAPTATRRRRGSRDAYDRAPSGPSRARRTASGSRRVALATVVWSRRRVAAAVHDADAVCLRLGQLRAGACATSTTSRSISRTRRATRCTSSSPARIDLAVHDANRALILEGIVWSAVAVGCTTLLGRATVRPRARSARGRAAAVHGRLLGLRRGGLSRTWRWPAKRQRWRCWPTRSCAGQRTASIVPGRWCGPSRSACAGTARSSACRCGCGRCGASRWRLRLASVGLAAADRRRLGGADGRAQRRLGRLSPGARRLPAGVVAPVGLRGRRFRLGRRHAGHLQPEFPDQLPAPDARRRPAAGAVSARAALRPGAAGGRLSQPVSGALDRAAAGWSTSSPIWASRATCCRWRRRRRILVGAGDPRPAATRSAQLAPSPARPRLALAAAGARVGLGDRRRCSRWRSSAGMSRRSRAASVRAACPICAPTTRPPRPRSTSSSSSPPTTTLVLAHDIFRQLHFYVPEYRVRPAVQRVRARFSRRPGRAPICPPGTEQLVVLDSPLQVAPEDAPRSSEVVLQRAATCERVAR